MKYDRFGRPRVEKLPGGGGASWTYARTLEAGCLHPRSASSFRLPRSRTAEETARSTSIGWDRRNPR